VHTPPSFHERAMTLKQEGAFLKKSGAKRLLLIGVSGAAAMAQHKKSLLRRFFFRKSRSF
jgi:hypothetical protein